jgi:hypothetical protein
VIGDGVSESPHSTLPPAALDHLLHFSEIEDAQYLCLGYRELDFSHAGHTGKVKESLSDGRARDVYGKSAILGS